MTNFIPDPKIVDKVSRAKAVLLLDHPFYGSTVCMRPIVIDNTTPTASCSARGTIRVGEKFASGLTTKQLMFLLAHEAEHHMNQHALRRNGRDHGKWNWAADAFINDTLMNAGVGEFIAGGVLYPNARDMSTDELYPLAPESSEGPGGIGADLSDEDGTLDSAEVEAIVARTNVEIIQAAKAAEAQGKLPAHAKRLLDKIINVRTPWYEILERYMAGRVRGDTTWARPNKRMHHMGVYLPSRGYVPSMGPVVVAVDTSGSINGKVLSAFAGHINRIMDTCKPESIHVIYCDAEINSTEDFTVEDLPIQLTKVTGGGGTSFLPVFEYLDKEGMEPAVVVYLTDGYGDQGRVSTRHEVVWLTTGSTDFNFGTVIPFDLEG